MKRLRTVKEKQHAVFLFMIAFLMLFFGIIFHYAKKFAVDNVYQQMESQAEYYVDTVDGQLAEVMRQQSDFFVDRQLVFLADKKLLNDYDKRNALLSVQEKLFILISSNEIVKDATLYIPNSNYVITPYYFRSFDGEAQEKLAEIKGRLERFVPQDGNLSYALSETPYAEIISPNFYLEVVFDREAFLRQLNNFSLQEGGACWINSEKDWFLEDTVGIGLAGRILESVSRSGGIKEARIDGVTYLVSVRESAYLGALVQYCSENAVLSEMKRYTTLFYVFLLVALMFAVLFSNYTERLINRPLKKLYAAFGKLQKGNLELSISHVADDEFAYIYNGFNHMVQELRRTIDEVYVQKNLAAQAELKQLQAQINPHFLYNSFFLLSGRIVREDIEGAGELADYLGTYFRYITRNGSDVVTLSEEMEHAEAYARIQDSRFSSRIKLIWEELPEEAKDIRVPRLIVQPILENAYKYGLEDREEGGLLHVYYQMEARELTICIENNGNITEEALQSMQERLSDGWKGEVTGIVNIHRRLKSFFSQEKGVGISRGQLGGALITITLPYREEKYVSAIDCGR